MHCICVWEEGLGSEGGVCGVGEGVTWWERPIDHRRFLVDGGCAAYPIPTLPLTLGAGGGELRCTSSMRGGYTY